MDQEKSERSKKKRRRKKAVRNTVYLVIALLLVGGLVLSATFGVIDFLARGGQPIMPPDPGEEQLAGLKEYGNSLEQSLEENPDDIDLMAELGHLYYQLAMVHWNKGLADEGDQYAEKGKERLMEAIEKGYSESWATLIVALLAMYDEDREMAETYFEKSLEIDEEDPEIHLYYGIYLTSVERTEQAQEHLERVQALAGENSQQGQIAQMYLMELDASDEPTPESPEPGE